MGQTDLMGNPYMVMVPHGKIDTTNAMGDPYMKKQRTVKISYVLFVSLYK